MLVARSAVSLDASTTWTTVSLSLPPMARRYLDPRNDLVFKRIFGEHPHILLSFLASGAG